MAIKLLLPQSLCELHTTEIVINAKTIPELSNSIKTDYPKLSRELLDTEGHFKNNVILICNDSIISKKEYIDFLFSDNTTLEIMFQFAGG